MPNLGLQLVSTNIRNNQEGLPSPATLSGLIRWYASDFGVLNSIGNNFTDETATIVASGFSPISNAYVTQPLNGTHERTGNKNGKAFYVESGGALYSNNRYGVEVFWDNTNNRWEIYGQAPTDETETTFTTASYYGIGNTTYPWQATWSNGTITRTATTLDTPATHNQQVRRWVNKVSGQSHAEQEALGSQPMLKVVAGQGKYVHFRATSNTGLFITTNPPLPVNPPLTYYAVLTNRTSGFQAIINNTTTQSRWRSVLEVEDSYPLIRQFSNSSIPSNGYSGLYSDEDAKIILCGSLDGIGNAFLRRVSASDDGEETITVPTGNNTSPNSVLGYRGWNFGGVNNGVDRLYEFLQFNVEHGPDERNLVINYLKSRHSL
jgi:hypothetical protein